MSRNPLAASPEEKNLARGSEDTTAMFRPEFASLERPAAKNIEEPQPDRADSDRTMANFFASAKRLRNWLTRKPNDGESLWKALISWGAVSVFVVADVGFGVGVLSMAPPEFIIAKVCFISSAAILFAKVAHWLSNPKTSRAERMILSFLIFGAVGVGLVEALYWVRGRQQLPRTPAGQTVAPTSSPTVTTLSIYPPFEEANEIYKKELGQPLNIKPQMIEQAYHARHEKATFLVIHDNWIYVLRENDQLTRVADGIVGEGENFTWYDDKDNLAKFSKRHGKPKDNLRPPWGTVAKTWYDHPKYEWFGWRVWHCWNRNYAYVQNFEHGLIVGSFRQWPEADAMRVVYVLVIDPNATEGKWYPMVLKSEGDGPPCVDPYTDKQTIINAAHNRKT